MRFYCSLCCCFSIFVVGACTDTTPPSNLDGSTSLDAAITDANRPDAALSGDGAIPDGAALDDGSVAGDASTFDDGSVVGDASTFDDGSVVGDASTFDDGSVVADASTFDDASVPGDGGGVGDGGGGIGDGGGVAGDGGGIGDGGVGDGGVVVVGDGGVSDGGGMGVDATTCAVNVTPTSGTTAAAFDFSGASNGTMCTVRIDGGAPLVVPCFAMLTLAGSTFGVGAHTVELFVGAGPSGPTSCMTTFTVSAVVGPVTTCAITVTPSSGGAATLFVADFDSNGTSCTASVDGVGLGTVDCLGMSSGTGSLFGVGVHTTTLSVVAGPGGPTSCSAMFAVTP